LRRIVVSWLNCLGVVHECDSESSLFLQFTSAVTKRVFFGMTRKGTNSAVKYKPSLASWRWLIGRLLPY
jgi:hypothetical protein